MRFGCRRFGLTFTAVSMIALSAAPPAASADERGVSWAVARDVAWEGDSIGTRVVYTNVLGQLEGKTASDALLRTYVRERRGLDVIAKATPATEIARLEVKLDVTVDADLDICISPVGNQLIDAHWILKDGAGALVAEGHLGDEAVVVQRSELQLGAEPPVSVSHSLLFHELPKIDGSDHLSGVINLGPTDEYPPYSTTAPKGESQ